MCLTGCMGLAPKEVDYADSVPPMPYGGNLDDKRIGCVSDICVSVLCSARKRDNMSSPRPSHRCTQPLPLRALAPSLPLSVWHEECPRSSAPRILTRLMDLLGHLDSMGSTMYYPVAVAGGYEPWVIMSQPPFSNWRAQVCGS